MSNDIWLDCPTCGKHMAKYDPERQAWEVKRRDKRGYVFSGYEYCSRCKNDKKIRIPPSKMPKMATGDQEEKIRPATATIVSRPEEATGG